MVIRVKQIKTSNMKKLQYIQPLTTVVRMQTVRMIAGSNEYNDNKTDLNPGTMDPGNGGDAASRRHSDWDDEEDEMDGF